MVAREPKGDDDMSFNVNKLNILYETPVEYLSSISKELGIDFYLKRDDLTPFGAGGNKVGWFPIILKERLQTKCFSLY